jgi:hypothetical protein
MVLHSCNWGWCRLNFDSRNELVNHVVHEHVKNAVPVRRCEVEIYRRVEEGIGESLSISSVMKKGGYSAMLTSADTQQNSLRHCLLLRIQVQNVTQPQPLPSSLHLHNRVGSCWLPILHH